MDKKPDDPLSLSPAGLGVLFMQQHWLPKQEYFTADEALKAFLDSELLKAYPKTPTRGWGDVWGSVMLNLSKSGLIKKAGRAIPTTGLSHASTTTLWMSLPFSGERTAIESGAKVVEELRRQWVDRKVTDLRQLLMKAYDMGYERGATDKAKRQETKALLKVKK